MPRWTKEDYARWKLKNSVSDSGSISQTPVSQCDIGHESLAKKERARLDAVRRFVRITSFRTHECDDRNLWDKYAVDALVEAGILFDDAPAFAQIEVEQQRVKSESDERTLIVVY